MVTLVLGASGATGKHLVNHLLKNGHVVKVVVRSSANIPEHWRNSDSLQLIEANVSEISVEEMAAHIKDCSAVASCLGHNITFKGLFGKPRRLCTEAVRLLCEAIALNAPERPLRLALMSTTAYVNSYLKEPSNIAQGRTLAILRVLLPPHTDNEQAAKYLWNEIGQDHAYIEWVGVRPYGLINEDKVSAYEALGSPIKPAVFDPRKTRRINVGHFMAELMTDKELWNTWKGQLPVIYDVED